MLLEWLAEFKDQIDKHGIRWGMVLTLYAIYRKERRNYRLDRRDELHNAYFAAILANQRIILKEMGREVECADISTLTKSLLAHRGVSGFMFSWEEKYFAPCVKSFTTYHSRRITMLKLLTTNKGRSFVYVILAAVVTALNNRYGLNLNTDSLFAIWALVWSAIQMETHFNLKTFISSAITALSGAAQTATTSTTSQPIQAVTTSPMTQQEATALLQELNTLLTPIYESAKSGRYTDSTVQAINAAATIRDYLKQQKGA